MLTEEAIVEQIQADQEMMMAVLDYYSRSQAWQMPGLQRVRCEISSGTSSLEDQGFDATTDMDLVFMTPAISYEETQQIEQELKRTYPPVRLGSQNQVYMHQHSPGTAPYH